MKYYFLSAIFLIIFVSLLSLSLIRIYKENNKGDDRKSIFVFVNRGNGGEINVKTGDTLTVTHFPHEDLEKYIYDGMFWQKIKQ